MARTLYKAKFENKLSLGGIATGHITVSNDASLSCVFPSFFAIKAEKNGTLIDARVLQGSQNDSIALDCFEKSFSSSFFPFAEISLYDTRFPGDITMTAFSPFIPLNDTDSGIPGVLFEFEITNTSDEKVDYSICALSQNSLTNAANLMGCTDTGEAYIHLTSNAENTQNTCIATNGKNVSFCEHASSIEDLIENFKINPTLSSTTDGNCNTQGTFGALCTHFSLGAGESTKTAFCLSWYNPENEFSRNYYAQYFESSLECASYLFRQKDRLYGQSMEFCENVYGATIPQNILDEVNNDLFSVIEKNHLRLDNGTLISNTLQNFSDIESFISRQDALSNLFPNLEHSSTMHFLKSEHYNNASDKDLCFIILRCYRKYVLSANTDELIEEWYYITKCALCLLGEDGCKKVSCTGSLIETVIKVLCEMAEAVKDKKRYEFYADILSKLPIGQTSMDIAEGFASIYETSGFEYRADTKHISFNPKSDLCPLDDGTFRCFFCTPQGYGFVEEGIDYIEINLIKGALSIRSFGVPRTPRLVQYGGRNWKFENKNKTAILDSDLEITPQKKLTIFIDIKQ